MDLNSVSMIMAPNLFLVQSGRHNKDLGGLQLSMAAGTSSIVRMLIKNQAIYWTVSARVHTYSVMTVLSCANHFSSSLSVLFVKKDVFHLVSNHWILDKFSHFSQLFN